MNSASVPQQILIVDDDKLICKLLSIRLQEFVDLPVAVRHHGKAALEYLETHPGRFLVLLDINMPVMNGWKFLDSLTRTRLQERVQVITVSSSIDTDDRKKALSYSPVLYYFEKPVLKKQFKLLKSLVEG